MTNSTWNDVQRRAAVSGSPILTKWKAEREAARGISNVTYSQDVIDAFGVNTSASGVSVNATSAMRVSAVAACVAKISGPIMSIPINAYRLTGGDIPEKLPRDDIWYKLNEQPSPFYTAASMWEGVSMAQLLRGDAFVLIRKSMNGSFKEFLPLPWGSVSPIRDVSGVRYYVNLPSHGINTWFDPEEILHFPGLGFDDSTMRSMSVIQYGARNAIGNAIAMDEYSGKFFEGGAHPSIVLSSASKMNSDQITGLQNAFAAKYAGLSNAHRLPLVLTEGISAKELSLSSEDAQLIEARKYQVLDIARSFGVPGHMINESTGSTSWGPGLEVNNKGFLFYVLQPWMKKIEQELNRKIYPRNTGVFLGFDRDSFIEGDIQSQSEYFQKALGGPGSGDGYMTINEVRRIKRMAPVEGGDELYRAPRDQSKKEGTPPNA